AVAVVVEERGRGAERDRLLAGEEVGRGQRPGPRGVAGQPGGGGRVHELAAGPGGDVAEEFVPADAGDEQVGKSVVVDVPGGHAERRPGRGGGDLRRDVGLRLLREDEGVDGEPAAGDGGEEGGEQEGFAHDGE